MVVHSPSSFHFYFLVVVNVLITTILIKYTNDQNLVYQMRPFISFVSVTLLAGKLLGQYIIFIIATYTIDKPSFYILPVITLLYLMLIVFMGMIFFFMPISNQK